MSPRFLVVGEALVDVIHGPEGAVAHPGGSPTNVAVGLARLSRLRVGASIATHDCATRATASATM